MARVLPCSSPKPLDSSRNIPGIWAFSAGGCSVSPRHALMHRGQGRACPDPAGWSLWCFLCSAHSRSASLPFCEEEGRQTPPVAQPLPLIPHTKKGKLVREGSLPHAVASAAAVTFSPLLVAQVPSPCAGCRGGAGPMERPVKDGILYVQHCKFGKRSWRKMRAQLFAASPSGVARMEKFDVRDDNTALEKPSLRQCARRVIRLSDCISVGPAGTESCPKATAAFYLTTTEKSYVLAAEQRDEWIAQLCQLAFQGAKETTQRNSRTQPSPTVPMEENVLYSSWQDLTEFLVLVVRTDAAARCGLHGHYLLSVLPQSLTLKDLQSRQPLLTWPYPFLRKFGQDQTVFSFEAGRRSDSGEGTFTFSTPRALELCRAVATAIACQQQGKDAPDPRLSAQGLEPQSWGPGAEDPQPSPILGGTQPPSQPPTSLICFSPAEPEATGPIIYASIARGQQQPLFAAGRPGSSEPWAAGKPPPEHLYENIFTAEQGPARAEEEEEEAEGRWELECRQAPEGHSSEATPLYDNRAALAQLPRGSPQPPEQRWGRGAQEALPGRAGHKPQSTLRARLVRLLSRETPGPRDWA
ncbi:docking protein 3 [Strigops habroptila]|uniref:docking protein 3 n=1 Tax=Strigops habroptila TaxID=2489341 RepID=UPI0011CF409C|nr:docking protein 3 [Strigops habroptila]